MNVTFLVDPSTDVLVAEVVSKTVKTISHNWQQGRVAHVVLTGGRTGSSIAETLDTDLFRLVNSETFSDTSKFATPFTLHIWFSDERFTPHDDADRTDSKLIAAFSKSAKLNNVALNFHRVASPVDSTLDEAARAYAMELDELLGVQHFDSVLLSMGEDGHIASLFPGLSTTAHATKSAVAVDNSPKPPAERVSISVDRLANSVAIYIFALGEGKREALEAFAGRGEGPVALLGESGTFGQLIIATDLKI
jgi:6-phosphogluconolactonase